MHNYLDSNRPFTVPINQSRQLCDGETRVELLLVTLPVLNASVLISLKSNWFCVLCSHFSIRSLLSYFSGLLVSYLFLKTSKRDNSTKAWITQMALYYVHRFIRFVCDLLNVLDKKFIL